MNTQDPFPVMDSQDHEILMYRDAHFSGNFSIMLAYYEEEAKGSYTDFEPKRIRALKEIEEKSQINLADELLDEEEQRQILIAKEKYLSLRDLYNQEEDSLAKALADLILTEDMEAEEEITQVVSYGKEAVDSLIQLIVQDDFYNPLFPGYGMAPAYAAKCLGLLKDPKAIPALFSVIGKVDFVIEEAVIDALRQIGPGAQEFLTKVLLHRPFTKENENAAIALLSFPLNNELAEVFLQALSIAETHQRPQLMSYLILGCEGLTNRQRQEEFKNIVGSFNSAEAIQESKLILKHWDSF